MTSLDKVAGGLITALIALLLGLTLLGSPFELQVHLEQDLTGPRGPITLVFNRPVQIEAVQDALSLTPGIAGRVEAESGSRLRFIPLQPLQPATDYQLNLSSGSLGKNGERLETGQSWTIHLRSPEVVYLADPPAPRELWRIDLQGGEPRQLTYTTGRIDSYGVAPDGEQIAFSVINDEGGADLWLVGRDGEGARLAHRCRTDRCTTPAWSPDGRQLAYTRQAAGLQPGSQPGAPRPWILDLIKQQDTPVFSDPQVIGYGSLWSPDGLRLASLDGIQGGIRILDLQTRQETFLPTQTGVIGGWSPDGDQMLFTRMEADNNMFHTRLFLADLPSGQTAPFSGDDDFDVSYGAPAWSPAGDRVAFSMKDEPTNPARGLWIMSPTDLQGPYLKEDPDYSYSFYQWDPWGTRLVFQRSRLKGEYFSEIVTYDLASASTHVLTANGSLPNWLP